MIKVFYIQIWFKFIFTFIFSFYKKPWSTEKRTLEKNSFFAAEYVNIIELYIAHYDVTCSLSRWSKGCNDIYKKDQ